MSRRSTKARRARAMRQLWCWRYFGAAVQPRDLGPRVHEADLSRAVNNLVDAVRACRRSAP